MKRPPHTLIYSQIGGRLGNQVLRSIHWIAWARMHEPEVEVLSMTLWPFTKFFDAWREYPGAIYPFRRSQWDQLARTKAALPEWMMRPVNKRYAVERAVHKLGNHRANWQSITLNDAQSESVDLKDPAFFERISECAVTTCRGWRFSSWPLVADQESDLRELFRVAPEYANPAREFIAGLRERHDLLIGVFIRQSDYRRWNDGRFFFPTSQYASWMRQLMDLYPGQRTVFVIASEELQNPDLLAGLPYCFTSGARNSGGHWFNSWVELSYCDIVVTPPSTFSATAAFVGGIPLWPIADATQTMSFAQLIQDGIIGTARNPSFSLSVK